MAKRDYTLDRPSARDNRMNHHRKELRYRNESVKKRTVHAQDTGSASDIQHHLILEKVRILVDCILVCVRPYFVFLTEKVLSAQLLQDGSEKDSSTTYQHLLVDAFTPSPKKKGFSLASTLLERLRPCNSRTGPKLTVMVVTVEAASQHTLATHTHTRTLAPSNTQYSDQTTVRRAGMRTSGNSGPRNAPSCWRKSSCQGGGGGGRAGGIRSWAASSCG